MKCEYKTTDYGKIPEDWDLLTIEDITKGMYDGPFGSNLKTEHYTDEREVRLIQLSNIGDEGWKEENCKYTTFKHAKTISRCMVHPGEVVMAKMMPAGRAIVCPNNENGYILSSDAVRLIMNSDVILPEFFVYLTKSRFFLDQVEEQTQGSTRARTSITKLKKNYVPVPKIEEQKAIVAALGDMDEKIECLEQELKKYRDLKQGMMQQLLTGEIRLV